MNNIVLSELELKVLEAGDSAELADECSSAVLRATYCSACRPRTTGGATGVSVRPCRRLCANVARGCLAAMSDVDQPWNDWIDAVERLGAALLDADLAVGDVLSSVDSRVSEAVLYALENAPLLDKKVPSSSPHLHLIGLRHSAPGCCHPLADPARNSPALETESQGGRGRCLNYQITRLHIQIHLPPPHLHPIPRFQKK